jgi:hypothetical protein
MRTSINPVATCVLAAPVLAATAGAAGREDLSLLMATEAAKAQMMAQAEIDRRIPRTMFYPKAKYENARLKNFN